MKHKEILDYEYLQGNDSFKNTIKQLLRPDEEINIYIFQLYLFSK